MANALWKCLYKSEVGEGRNRGRREFGDSGPNLLSMLLKSNNVPLLVNCCGLVWAVALDHENSDKLGPGNSVSSRGPDFIRLLWSLLSKPDSRVKANALGALSQMLQSEANVNYAQHHLMNGMPLLLKCLDVGEVRLSLN